MVGHTSILNGGPRRASAEIDEFSKGAPVAIPAEGAKQRDKKDIRNESENNDSELPAPTSPNTTPRKKKSSKKKTFSAPRDSSREVNLPAPHKRRRAEYASQATELGKASPGLVKPSSPTGESPGPLRTPRSMAEMMGDASSAGSPSAFRAAKSTSLKPRTVADMMGSLDANALESLSKSVPLLQKPHASGYLSDSRHHPPPILKLDSSGPDPASKPPQPRTNTTPVNPRTESPDLHEPSASPPQPHTVSDIMDMLLEPDRPAAPSKLITRPRYMVEWLGEPLNEPHANSSTSCAVSPPFSTRVPRSSSGKLRSVADMMGEYSPDWILSRNNNLRQRKQKAVQFLLEYNDLDEEVPLVAFTPGYTSSVLKSREKDDKIRERDQTPKRIHVKKDGDPKDPQSGEPKEKEDDEEHLDMQLEFLQNWHKYNTTKQERRHTQEEPDTIVSTPKITPPTNITQREANDKARSSCNPDAVTPSPAPRTNSGDPKKAHDLQSLLNRDEDLANKEYQGLDRLLGVHQNDLEFVENKVNAWEKLKTLNDKEKAGEKEKKKEYQGLGKLLGVHENELDFVENKVDAREKLKSLKETEKAGEKFEKEKENEDLSKVLGVKPDDFGKYLEDIVSYSTLTLLSVTNLSQRKKRSSKLSIFSAKRMKNRWVFILPLRSNASLETGTDRLFPLPARRLRKKQEKLLRISMCLNENYNEESQFMKYLASVEAVESSESTGTLEAGL